MGDCPECGQAVDELPVSDTTVASGVVYECPHCEAIVDIVDATDIQGPPDPNEHPSRYHTNTNSTRNVAYAPIVEMRGTTFCIRITRPVVDG